MIDRKLIIAVFLSVAFLMVWSAVAPRMFPQLEGPKPPKANRATTPTQPPAATSSSPQPALTAATTPPPSKAATSPGPAVVVTAPVQAGQLVLTRVEHPEYTAIFSNRGAQLTSFRLKKYKTKSGELVDLVKSRARTREDYPFAIGAADAALSKTVNGSLYSVDDQTEGTKRTIRYRFADGKGLLAEKSFVFTREYPFNFEVRLSGTATRFAILVGPGIRTLEPGEADSQFITTGNGVLQIAGDTETLQRDRTHGLRAFPRVDFIGIQDNYFLSVLKPKTSGEALLRSTESEAAKEGKEARSDLFAGLNAAGGVVAGEAFFGPKEVDLLGTHGYGATIEFGMFDVIARMLLKALVWINGYTHNYGWAIVLLTIVIKIALYPLQHKSMVSMKKMASVQPKVTALKEKYKKAKSDAEQRQKMNADMMKLYAQEGINPMSGCLPLVLQMPILLAFYQFLSQAIELRGAPFFGWISDLSAKDPYYITPFLMTATMFIQQWMTPATGDPVQRKMFLAMPVVMGWIFKEFPSGLVLYWIVQNVLTIIQQMILNRYWKSHPESLAPVKVERGR